MRSGIDIAVRDLSVTSEQGNVENLNAAVRVDGPWPLSTPKKQLLSMALVDFGLQLQNGLIAFQLSPWAPHSAATSAISFWYRVMAMPLKTG